MSHILKCNLYVNQLNKINLPLCEFDLGIFLVRSECNFTLPVIIDEEKLQNVPLLLSFTELISFFPVNSETIGGRKEIPF